MNQLTFDGYCNLLVSCIWTASRLAHVHAAVRDLNVGDYQGASPVGVGSVGHTAILPVPSYFDWSLRYSIPSGTA